MTNILNAIYILTKPFIHYRKLARRVLGVRNVFGGDVASSGMTNLNVYACETVSRSHLSVPFFSRPTSFFIHRPFHFPVGWARICVVKWMHVMTVHVQWQVCCCGVKCIHVTITEYWEWSVNNCDDKCAVVIHGDYKELAVKASEQFPSTLNNCECQRLARWPVCDQV